MTSTDTKKPKTYQLRSLRVKRIDLVDRGASFDPETGAGAHVLIYKSADLKEEVVMEDVTKKPTAQAPPPPTTEPVETRGDVMNEIRAAMRRAALDPGNPEHWARFIETKEGKALGWRHSQAVPSPAEPTKKAAPVVIEGRVDSARLARMALAKSMTVEDYVRSDDEGIAAYERYRAHAGVEIGKAEPAPSEEAPSQEQTLEQLREAAKSEEGSAYCPDRIRLVQANALNELSPLVAALRDDDATLTESAALAKAVELVPGIAACAREGWLMARRDATVAQLENEHAQRAEMVLGLIEASQSVKKNATQRMSLEASMRRLLGTSPDASRAARSGDPTLWRKA